MSAVPSDSEFLASIPDDAFIGSAKLEGTVVLETALHNHALVDQAALLTVFEHLAPSSVEVALAKRPDMIGFADNHCLVFAAIRTPVKIPLPASIELCTLDLPDRGSTVKTDSPILPSDPSTIYAALNAYHKIRDQENWFSSICDTEQKGQGYQYNSTPPPRKAVFQWNTVGIVYLTMSHIPHEVHIGITLLPQFRRQGYGIKACAFAVQWALETTHAHRVQARILTSPHLSRAKRLFTALGFAYEGVQRRALPDAAGVWTDVTQMAMIDTDWLIRRRLQAAPRNEWDELLMRHQREREELLNREEFLEMKALTRTSSMETICYNHSSSGDASTSATSTPSPSPPISRRSSVEVKVEESEPLEEHPWRSPLSTAQSDIDDPFSDSEWVLSDRHSDHSSEELIMRPLSAASSSSFESIGSTSSYV